MAETWKDIPGWENLYQASSLGRVRSLDRVMRDKLGMKRHFPGRVLKGHTDHRGYPRVALTRQSVGTTCLVHRLVMLAFVGPCPEGQEVAHYDGNPRNAALTNLRYDTRAGNHADKIRHGTSRNGVDSPLARLTEQQVLEIRENIGELTQKELSQTYNVSQTHISRIQTGKLWKHIKAERPFVTKEAKGSRNGAAKLSEAQALKIIELRGTDSTANIGKQFGVSQSQVSAIQTGSRWSHLSKGEKTQ